MTEPAALTPGGASELVPLARRTNVLHAFRLAMVVAVLASTSLAPRTVGAPVGALAAVTAVYVLIAVGVEAVRRLLKTRTLPLVGALLLADGLWIAVVVTRTGGPRSVLSVLVLLHVIAVTLLASYRTGLKIAVWHSLLFVAAHYLHAAEITRRWEPPAFAALPAGPDSAVVAGVVTFLAVAIGTAAFSSLNERELRRSRRTLQGLADMGSKLQDVRSPDQVGPVTLRSVLRTFNAPRAVMVVGDEDRVGRFWVADAEDVRPVDSGERPGVVLRRCWQERKPQLARTAGPDAPVLSKALPDAKNLVVAPMVADGCVIGALVVEQGGGLDAVVSGTRVNAMVEFAAHAALSLRSATLLAQVERLARVDELTGLANRRSFEEALNREVARSSRSGEALSLVLMDIDHFKIVNDTHGHDRGDEVLRLVGTALSESVRHQLDLPARHGGDEFALLLPACSAAAAANVCEEVRAIISLRADGLGLGKKVTLSCGVASFPLNAVTGADLVKAADEALYQSKRDGRDRVTVATGLAPEAVAPGAARIPVPV